MKTLALAAFFGARLINFQVEAETADPIQAIAERFHYDVLALYEAYRTVCTAPDYSSSECARYFHAWQLAYKHWRMR